MSTSFFGPGGYGAGLAGGLLGGLSSLFPGAPTTTTSSGSSSSTGSQTTNPLLSQSAQNFLDQLTGMYSNLITQTPNLAGYQGAQANNINSTSQAAQTALNANLAARGLSNSPIAATASNALNMNRINQQNQLNQSIPLLSQQIMQGVLGQGTQFFNSIPRGQTSDFNQNQNFNQTQKTQTGGSGWGGLLGTLGGVLGAIPFSDKRLKKDLEPMDGKESLKIIGKLAPLSFKWKENNEPGHGFTAQAVSKVLPKSVIKDDNGFHRLDMIQTIPHLVAAVNHLAQSQKAGGAR